MKFEFLPTGETCVGYLWDGFKDGEIAADPVYHYDTNQNPDGLALCNRCHKFKQSHGMLDVQQKDGIIICPGTYIMTAQQGQRLVVYGKDDFFTKNFKILSHGFINSKLSLVNTDGVASVP